MDIRVIPANKMTPDHISAWSDLQRVNSELHNPFLRPEFTTAVAAVRDDIEVAVFEKEGSIIGFFPFQRDFRNVGRAVGWRVSDFQGAVIGKNVKWEAKELIQRAGLSSWHFDHLLASQTPFLLYHRYLEDSPYMNLTHGYDAYAQERCQSGSSFISQAMRKSRKINREQGPLRLDLHTTSSCVFASLLTWKQQQLNRSHYLDVFRSKWIISLLESLRTLNTKEFSAMLSALYAGDTLIAVHLGLHSYDILSSWIPTFNPQYREYSPGMILHIMLAEKVAEMGIKRIELGRGLNQLKRGLMSGANPVAIGSVDLRPLNRIKSAGWFRARSLIHSFPMQNVPLRVLRRMRNLVRHN